MTDDFATVIDKELSPVGELKSVQTVFSRTDSWDKALNNRPDILKSTIALERADIRLKFNKNQLYPQLDLIGSYGLSGSDSADIMHMYDGKASAHRVYNPEFNPADEQQTIPFETVRKSSGCIQPDLS